VRCSHPWHANFSHNGIEHRVSLHKWAKKPVDYEMLQGEAKSLFRAWTTAIEGGDEQPPAEKKIATVTLDAIAKIYITEYVHHPDRREKAAKEMDAQVQRLCATIIERPEGGTVRLGNLAASAVTKPLIEAFRHGRRQKHETDKAAIVDLATFRAARAAQLEVDPKATPIEIPADVTHRARLAHISTKAGRVSTNRLLARLRHMYAWAIAEKGLLEASPFAKGGVSVVKLDTKAEGPRSRRLNDDEETRLLQHAGAHLRACIEATLETGMRRGEILGLQWLHVREQAGVIELPASMTKTGIARHVIITARLAAILDMRKTVQRTARELPDDADLPGDCHPFGNELGERVNGFKTAWKLTCKRAGISGLRFHDLRREAGSRLLEAPGVSLTDVRDFLGHASVTMTNTYLASTTLRLRDALRKRDTARTSLAQPPIAASSGEGVSGVTH